MRRKCIAHDLLAACNSPARGGFFPRRWGMFHTVQAKGWTRHQRIDAEIP